MEDVIREQNGRPARQQLFQEALPWVSELPGMCPHRARARVTDNSRAKQQLCNPSCSGLGAGKDYWGFFLSKTLY